jgi:anti-anti-sigma factor
MPFTATLEGLNEEARITLTGELDASVALTFQKTVEEALTQRPKRLILFMQDLDFMASAGLRVLIFAKQKMGAGVGVYVIGSKGPVLNTLQMSGFQHSVYIQETYMPE